MHEFLYIHTLDPARKYLRGLSGKEHAALLEEIQALGNGDPTARTKQLRGPVRELILGHHRLTYFKIDVHLFVVRGFRKKTRKTPLPEIEYAERMYALLKQM